MIKIIPVIISPLIFFYVYYNVVFLTDQNIENLDNKKEISEKIIDDSEADSSSKNQFIDGGKMDLAKSNDKKIDLKAVQIEKLDSNKNIDKKLKVNKVKEEVIEIKPVENNKNIKSSDSDIVVKIQFGAFKKRENAQKLMNKLRELFEKEFREIPNAFEIIEKDIHFKVIYLSNSNNLAKELCKFSKSKKVNCIIL